MYQINTRQFTPEGTFSAATGRLPRLRELGVDIIYLMPIHEIGAVNRKGGLGSPYSVRDYYSVNSEFGTAEDFRRFVAAVHASGMHVIIDWVGNHTAWDNPLAAEHPEWYLRDWKGRFRPTPWRDWPDVIDLDYRSSDLRRYMADALVYWVREFDIDGYRCDVAGLIPTDFWDAVRRRLEEVKPVFMLAEWDARDLHEEAFDLSYAWSWFDAMKMAVREAPNLDALYMYYSRNETAFPADGMRMLFVSNHDKNAWEGTEFEIFGKGVGAAIVLSFVSKGMPLIYNGQEAGNSRRLAFFEKDPIEWRDHPHSDLYRRLIRLKKNNPALWNGQWGANMEHVPNTVPRSVLSFVRMTGKAKVFAVFNLSDREESVAFTDGPFHGRYREYFTGERVEFPGTPGVDLTPWGYKIFVSS